ncbi:Piso0_001769 [Millerozyma farinosa CBS 7064]|uniref:Piso0_001769 protein n=1 Tax=Pichia sorbitophila (strain ATCC MYA-4447 / BCRC 22081 / CBS 7064 / NBRC 10061 / NRRL Y-12695) TaxID=559304 RepID=G8YLP1_PICSO|nr:Piso0_001769 [Millerozyma farinosa CBS 7064]
MDADGSTSKQRNRILGSRAEPITFSYQEPKQPIQESNGGETEDQRTEEGQNLKPGNSESGYKYSSSMEAEDVSPKLAQEAFQNSNIICPICEETMVSLYQLNQHIDDVHQSSDANADGRDTNNRQLSTRRKGKEHVSSADSKGAANSNTRPARRRVKLDVLDSNRGFSISSDTDNEASLSDDPAVSPRVKSGLHLSRRHWRQPSNDIQCYDSRCRRFLNIKNGLVNCRKCGNLFCNIHCNKKVRLRNSDDNEGTQYDNSKNGVWARCCDKCYFEKPDLKLGTQVKMNDLTEEFMRKRALSTDKKELDRIKIQKRFIKLANLHASHYLSQLSSNRLSSAFLSFIRPTDDIFIESEKEIVGPNNWQDDKKITHCNICFTQFNILLRKHHCRLCGRIVCDNPLTEQQPCSMNVPIGSLMNILPDLNYSDQIIANRKKLMEADSPSLFLRFCASCKDVLLSDWKVSQDNVKHETVFQYYDRLLVLKHQLSVLKPRFENSIAEFNAQEANKLRLKVMNISKDFESQVWAFRNTFFANSGDRWVVMQEYADIGGLLQNIYSASSFFLQEFLLDLKELNSKLQSKETATVRKNKDPASDRPKLTKKQIRELRDSLMVMQEQKFLIENTIEKFTKLRKFDELVPLMENRDELDVAIKDLEQQLGEFGF